VQTALHTTIHRYVVNGEAHWANANDPQVPVALAPVVSGFVSLHNFQKKPASVRSGRTAVLTRTSEGKPQINFTDGTHGLAPADFNTIYNIAPTMTGAGVTIGVVARSNIIPQDVADFRSIFGLGGSGPNIILNGSDPGDLGGNEEAEAVLDSTWPGAVAPAATVDIVVSESTNAAAGEDLSEFYIIDNNLADVMTESFAICEAGFGSLLFGPNGFAQSYSSLAEQAAAQGITYLVASGDSGPDSCADPSIVQASPFGASVNLLASTPFTVAVGGTQFDDTANPNTFWNANNSANLGSAKSYIPENVWNESCTVAQCGLSAGLWSSGGGQSIAFPKPSWQAGVAGIPAADARFVPDVSLAAADHDAYVLCLDASCEGSSPSFRSISGTSASAQSFGGVMALLIQKVGTRVGIANFALYKLAATETLSSCNASNPTTLPANFCIFNDVTVGNTNLTVVNENGFSAGVGYDEATGLGSVNVSNLVNKWSTAIVDATTTTLTLNNGTAVNVTHGSSVPVGITVTPVAPATGTPTGDVSLIASSKTDLGVDAFTLSGGSVSSAFNSTILLPGGTYQVHAHYEGDGTFLGSDSAPPINVTVSREGTEINFGIVVSTATTCSTPSSITYGSPYVLTADVSDLNVASTPCAPNETGSSPTGTVTLTDSFNGGAAAPLDGGSFKLNSFGYFEDQTIQLPAGTHTITANYLGDNSFTSSAPAMGVITVGKASTTTAVAANPTSTQAGQQVTLTVTVSTQSNATANASQEPTGTVQFSLNGSNFGTAVTVTGGVNTNTFFARAVATLSTTTLANGSNVITAQYSGDSNYIGSSTTSSVTVTVGSPGINESSGCSGTITISSPGGSGTCVITVTGANGFAGTVGLSYSVNSTPAGAVDVPRCTFGAPDLNFTSPNTITLSAASTTGNATMTCSSMAPSGVMLRPSNRPSGRGWPLTGGAITVVCFLLLLAVLKHRRWGLVPLAVLLFVVAAAGVSCSGGGYGGGGGTSNLGTTTGAYTLTVTATPRSGTATTMTVTVNVQ
jgi:hypothetical protein